MVVSTRGSEPTKMKKTSSASKLLASIVKSSSSKPAVPPKPTQRAGVQQQRPRDPPKVAPKPGRNQRPAVPPKPTRRRSQVSGRQSSGSEISTLNHRRSIRTPTRRTSGRLVAKTPGWSSPTEESFKRPISSNSRRTSIYQKRLRHSLLDADPPVSFSPSKTRRRSVYGVAPRSPPRPSLRRSLVQTGTSRLPKPLDPGPSFNPGPSLNPGLGLNPGPSFNPVLVIDPLAPDLVRKLESGNECPASNDVKLMPKKRRPVCGVAALRRQSLLPESAPFPPTVPCPKPVLPEGRDEVDAKVPKLDESADKNNVEIVEMTETMSLMTPPKPESGTSDPDFFTPAGKGLLDTSLYQTPAVKVKATPSGRLPQSASRRRARKTPRRTDRVSVSCDYEILPVNSLLQDSHSAHNNTIGGGGGGYNNGNQTISEVNEDEEHIYSEINGHSGDKNDSSRCTVS